MKRTDFDKTKKHRIIDIIIGCLVIFLGLICIFSACWYMETYGDVGFASILYTLFSRVGGVQSGLVDAYLLEALLPCIALSALVCFAVFFKPKKKFALKIKNKRFTLYPLSETAEKVISVSLAVVLIFCSVQTVGITKYFFRNFEQTDIYEKEYVDPKSVDITFPSQKRNLIYIFLESVETSYFSESEGGTLNENIMPELHSLAEDNLNFSDNGGVGGFSCITGAKWTSASLVAQTSGLPLKTPIVLNRNIYSEKHFLSGAVTLSDILNENGYRQALMVGSDVRFGNRDAYYKCHGTDEIYDIYTARKDGIIPEDYFVWWGMEDMHLFEYAKQKLCELSSDSSPFAFTVLTVDTHPIDGYTCSLCENNRTEKYENVISCSSKQVYAFVEWLKEQDFYENTTVIICGDHFSMNNKYMKRAFKKDYTGHIYNCILNSAAETENTKNREFAAMDMFPTTLAAMGCDIEGERLGLGTNLFSEKPTLCETMGVDKLDREMQKGSRYYTRTYFK